MRGEGIIWVLLAAGSLRCAVEAGARPPPPDAPLAPRPLPRPPTAAEVAQARELEGRLREDLDAARARLGRPLEPQELEGPLPDGAPALRHGLPDNPARPGVARLHAACPLADDGLADWLYCPDDGSVRAAGLPTP